MCTERAVAKAYRKQAKYMERLIKIEARRDCEIIKAQQKGMFKTMVEIVRKMKKAGLSFDEIAEFTDLPFETIERM